MFSSGRALAQGPTDPDALELEKGDPCPPRPLWKPVLKVQQRPPTISKNNRKDCSVRNEQERPNPKQRRAQRPLEAEGVA